MKPRLLVVPHLYAENLCIRGIELARRLTSWFDVYCLKWTDALHVEARSTVHRRWNQFRTALRCVMAGQNLSQGADGIAYVQAPVLQPILLNRLLGVRHSLQCSRWWNRRIIEQLIGAHGINHLLLASDSFGLPSTPAVRVFFDVVDWFPEENSTPGQLATVRTRLKSIAGQVRGIFAVSEPLCEKLKAECGVEAVPLPNGADLNVLRSVCPEKIEAVRRRYALADKFVIGYIGNHGPYTGVDFVVKVFQAVRQRIPEAVLLLVGPADYWAPVLAGMSSQGVIATGPVPPADVAAYFNAINLGLLAQEKTLGTEFAFQIKVVEYTASRKFVVSTPLETWQRLQWPNILLAELEVEAWVAAICKARESRWSPAWDTLTEPYDWNALAQKMATLMLDPN